LLGESDGEDAFARQLSIGWPVARVEPVSPNKRMAAAFRPPPPSFATRRSARPAHRELGYRDGRFGVPSDLHA